MAPQTANWYPGLMARTRRFLDRHLEHLDLVLEVVDARAPRTCRWHGLATVLDGKPRLMILNKADLADPSVTAAWRRHSIDMLGVPAVAADAVASGQTARSQARSLIEAIRGMSDRSQPKRSIKVAALGVPNVGKSSVLNLIGGRHKAQTGARPGLTRGQQWIVLPGSIWLLDLPGVLPPAPRDQDEVAILSLLGILPDGAFSEVDAAAFLIRFLQSSMSRERLTALLRIGADAPVASVAEPTALDWLTAWALRRGALEAGGRPSLPHAAAMLIAEFRRGGLGRISLEQPPAAERQEESE